MSKKALALAPFAIILSAAEPPPSQQARGPTSADLAVLKKATEECHLHDGALSFVQRALMIEPVIRMTRAFGDTDEQLNCALKYFPEDFNARFGSEFEADAPREK